MRVIGHFKLLDFIVSTKLRTTLHEDLVDQLRTTQMVAT